MKKKEETIRERRTRAAKIVRVLRREFDGPKTALTFRDPFELLIATILSAQCTDKRVNMVTPGLFRKYKGPKAFAAVSQEELEEDIRSTGFFRNKAKSIRACSQQIVEKHRGRVPDVFDELVRLPGVGRKTANCVMGGAFGVNSGVVVDTHVQRISGLLGLTSETNPVKIERDIMEIVPQKDWYDVSNLLILHGRKTCVARKPRCGECSLLNLCPSGPGILLSGGKKASPSTTKQNKKGGKGPQKRRG